MGKVFFVCFLFFLFCFNFQPCLCSFRRKSVCKYNFQSLKEKTDFSQIFLNYVRDVHTYQYTKLTTDAKGSTVFALGLFLRNTTSLLGRNFCSDLNTFKVIVHFPKVALSCTLYLGMGSVFFAMTSLSIDNRIVMMVGYSMYAWGGFHSGFLHSLPDTVFQAVVWPSDVLFPSDNVLSKFTLL